MKMRWLWWVFIISGAFTLGAAGCMAYFLMTMPFYEYQVTLFSNVYHEGNFEAIVIPISVLISFISFCYIIKKNRGVILP